MATTEMNGRRIAVIGAGAAGLAAAMRLTARGAAVTVYDRAARPGGLLRTEALAGAQLDTAVQLLSSTYTRTFALAEAAGARGLLVRASGRDALWRKGSAQEITYGSIPSMVSSGALPALLKMKLAAKYVPYLTLQAAALDANDLAGDAGATHDRTDIARWGGRELGEDFVEYLAYPLLAAYYGSSPEETSAALYHALARVGMSVEVYAVHGGMSALAQAVADAAAARGATLRLNTRVDSITGAGTAWRITADEGDEMFDGVVIATPPDVASALLVHSDSSALRAWLDGVKLRHTASIGVVLDGAVRASWFGVSIPRHAAPGGRVVAMTIQQNKPAQLVPPRMTALTIFPSPSAAEEVARMDAAAAETWVRGAVEQIFAGAGPRIRAVAVYPGAYRLFEPGIVQRLQTLRAMQLPRGLAIAGDYTTAPTVEGAVRSGERAADGMS